MITYLTIISELHGKLSGLPVKDLTRTAGAAEDPLTGWAAGYLARSRDRSLQPMLDAAMQRTYSAAPETFFTGGGNQSFGNFESLGGFRQRRPSRTPFSIRSTWRSSASCEMSSTTTPRQAASRSNACSATPTTRSARPI